MVNTSDDPELIPECISVSKIENEFLSSGKTAEEWIAELELMTLPDNVGYMKPTSVNTLEVIGRRGQPRKASSTIYYLQKVRQETRKGN